MRKIKLVLLFFMLIGSMVGGCTRPNTYHCANNPTGNYISEPLAIAISSVPRRDGITGPNLLTHACLGSFLPELEAVKMWNALGGKVYKTWDEDVPDDTRIISIGIGLADAPKLVGLYNGQDIFIKEHVVCGEGIWGRIGKIVVAHEVGHALGLGHLKDDQKGVMSASIQDICGLTADDVELWKDRWALLGQ